MVKLKRLKILKYRNIKPGTELHFDDGINLILGQNASGKTTLLALISAVCRGDFREIEGEDFQLEADLTEDQDCFALVASNLHERAHGQQLRWSSSFEVLRRYPNGESKIFRFENLPRGWLSYVVFKPTFPERIEVEDLFGNLEDNHEAYRFDEALDAFAACTGRLHPLRGPATPPASRFSAILMNEDGETFFDSTYIPTEVASALENHTEVGTVLASQIAESLASMTVNISANVTERTSQNPTIILRVEGFTFEVKRRDGTTLHHDRLSYGQKRLIAFFYYLACNPSVVIADELVNGLHHRWIEASMKALGDRQAFLTSQNPLLFDYVEFDSVEQVRSRFITCRLEDGGGRTHMVWENMSEPDAERFFAAYQTGIEHVGDILITRGMW